MEINTLITEWFYRLPKGYASHPYSESELIVLKSVLEENKIVPDNILNKLRGVYTEAKLFNHTDKKYIINRSYIKSWEKMFSSGEIEAMLTTPFDFTTELDSSAKYILINKQTENLKIITYDQAKQYGEEKITSFLTHPSLANTYIVAYGEINLLTELKTGTKTDTDEKEGLVVAMFYAKIDESITADNYSDTINKLLETIPTISEKSLDSATKGKLVRFLTGIQNSVSKESIIALNDPLAAARSILDTYAGWDVIRSGYFNTIRSTASKISKLPADKWCPGDVYIQKPGSDGTVDEAISQANQGSDDALGHLNKLFIEDWGATGGNDEVHKEFAVLVAVSLKQAEARAGKAKSFLPSLSRKDFTYNLSKDEQSYSIDQYKEGIRKFRKHIKELSRFSDITIILKQDDGDRLTDPKKIKEKYASLKQIVFLLGEKGPELDNIVLRAASFGMSLTGSNPTFFKLVGNKSGVSSKPQKFEAGMYPFLSSDGLDSDESDITIVDLDTNNNIQFRFHVMLGEEIYKVVLQASSNGGDQAALEVIEAKPISH